MDDNLGRILDALDSSGLRDDTLVIYTTDHGDMVGKRGLWGKTVRYEESAGIPLMISGPGVPRGQISRTPVTLVDGYQTILGAAGVSSMPDDEPRPGRSWVEIANGADDDDRVEIANGADEDDRVAFAEYHAMGATSAAFLVRRGRYKLHHYVGFEPELFDLEADPEETTNLAGDPAYSAVLAEHDALLRAIVDQDDVDRQAKAD
jgi:choline-sulfatase